MFRSCKLNIDNLNMADASQLSRWQAFAVIDILTEVMIIASIVFIVWTLRVSVSRKLAVVQAFAPRLL